MKKIFKITLICLLIIVIIVMSINFFVIYSTNNKIINIENIKKNKYDAILVLGASVKGDEPSPMLEERIKTAIELYNDGYADKIIMSGDNSTVYYDEVTVMKNYAVSAGIPEEIIYLDHAGLSTYESVSRAKEKFDINSVIIVSQKYHLHRAIYVANDIDLEVIGVSSDGDDYEGQFFREIREIGARNKDFFLSIIK